MEIEKFVEAKLQKMPKEEEVKEEGEVDIEAQKELIEVVVQAEESKRKNIHAYFGG